MTDLQGLHPITEYGTTRCPLNGGVAAEIDEDDGTCWSCGSPVRMPELRAEAS